MNPIEALRTMMDSEGISVRKLGELIGKAPSYATTILYGRKSMPNVSIFAEMADACGYDLLVRRRSDGDEIPIDYDEW